MLKSSTTTSPSADRPSTLDEVASVPHPGGIVKLEFLAPLDITQHHLAKEAGMAQPHVFTIVRGYAGMTAPIAVRLADDVGNLA